MSNLKEELIKKARRGEPVFQPYSEMQVIKNLLNMAGNTHAMRIAAYLATEIFGREWLDKKPKTDEFAMYKEQLRQIVMKSGKQEGDTRYVRWQRFQEFAKTSYLDQILTPPTNQKKTTKTQTASKSK